MKKTLVILICFYIMTSVYAESYWDQFEPVEPVKKKRYWWETALENCGNDVACQNRVHNAVVSELNSMRRELMYNDNDEPIQIHYGYNAVGDYVPTSFGDREIKYGYNSYGEYVPISF